MQKRRCSGVGTLGRQTTWVTDVWATHCLRIHGRLTVAARDGEAEEFVQGGTLHGKQHFSAVLIGVIISRDCHLPSQITSVIDNGCWITIA